MLRALIIITLVSLSLWAKVPYKVGVCGSSRYVEELELALELESRVLVGSCLEKKLDAKLLIKGDQLLIVFADGKELLRKRGIRVAKLVGDIIAQIERPKYVPPSKPHVASVRSLQDSYQEVEISEPEPVINLVLTEQINDESKKISWGIDMAVTMDQWNVGLSTKLYPGFQMQTKVEVAPLWYVGDRFAFGTSAFRIDDQVVWNQQVGNHLWASRQFEIAKGLSMGPAMGYFLWGSFAGDAQIPQFQKHDVSVGGRMMWTSPKRAFELECAAAFLAVHLGVEGQLATRVYLASNWYASLQGYAVGTWGMNQAGSFLSASLGLGYAQ